MVFLVRIVSSNHSHTEHSRIIQSCCCPSAVILTHPTAVICFDTFQKTVSRDTSINLQHHFISSPHQSQSQSHNERLNNPTTTQITLSKSDFDLFQETTRNQPLHSQWPLHNLHMILTFHRSLRRVDPSLHQVKKEQQLYKQ